MEVLLEREGAHAESDIDERAVHEQPQRRPRARHLRIFGHGRQGDRGPLPLHQAPGAHNRVDTREQMLERSSHEDRGDLRVCSDIQQALGLVQEQTIRRALGFVNYAHYTIPNLSHAFAIVLPHINGAVRRNRHCSRG